MSSTVKRAADVLLALTDLPEVGVSELSRQLGWPKSVAHRILTTLAQSGLVAVDASTHRYRLGPAALRLGLAAIARADVHRLAIPHLRALRDHTGETATLTLLSGDSRLYVEVVESRHLVRQTIEVGSHAPLYVGGSSKAILAFLPPAEQERVLASARGAKRADGTPLDIDKLRKELVTIRRRGYAVSLGERIAGATSVAAPIFDGRGLVIGSMSAAGVTVRQVRSNLEALGPVVRAEAHALSAQLGWQESPATAPGTGRTSKSST